MPYGNNVYQPFLIINGIDDAIFAFTNTPQILAALYFSATFRTGNLCELFNSRKDAAD